MPSQRVVFFKITVIQGAQSFMRGNETHAIPLFSFQKTFQIDLCRLSVFRDKASGERELVQEASFSKDVIRLGAHADCDLIIDDPTVSRFHCEIRRKDQRLILVDQRSTNGTFIGDIQVLSVYLNPGAEFRLGHTVVRVTQELESLPLEEVEGESYGALLGASQVMRELYSLIDRVAPSDLSVVIEGETGTGKELVARAIHERSRRAQRPFVVFDCSAVPESLIESELFGHERGAFSGAIKQHRGVFEQAHNGTLFLDELGELELHLQPKLLRALESGMIRRVGGEEEVRVDVRVVAATNRSLKTLVQEGLFRSDLFYRLTKVHLSLPPLRARGDDVCLISRVFLERLNERARLASAQGGAQGDPRHLQGIDDEVYTLLKRWPWPGNVRELRNVIERAYTFATPPYMRASDLPTPLQEPHDPITNPAREVTIEPLSFSASLSIDQLTLQEQVTLKEAKELIIAHFERDYLIALLERHQRNISAVAREAGIDRRHVYRLIKKYDV
jgi:transcriptional regulator with GAF, ATPase, and Fis domain